MGHLYLPFLWKMSPSCIHVCVQGCYPLQWATNISSFDGKRAYPAYVCKDATLAFGQLIHLPFFGK